MKTTDTFEARLREIERKNLSELGGAEVRWLIAAVRDSRDTLTLADQRGRREWERRVAAEGERDAWRKEAEGSRSAPLADEAPIVPASDTYCHAILNDGRHVCRLAKGHDGEHRAMMNVDSFRAARSGDTGGATAGEPSEYDGVSNELRLFQHSAASSFLATEAKLADEGEPRAPGAEGEAPSVKAVRDVVWSAVRAGYLNGEESVRTHGAMKYEHVVANAESYAAAYVAARPWLATPPSVSEATPGETPSEARRWKALAAHWMLQAYGRGYGIATDVLRWAEVTADPDVLLDSETRSLAMGDIAAIDRVRSTPAPTGTEK